MLRRDERLAARSTDTEMAARHDQSIFLLREADEALSVRVLVIDGLLAFSGVDFVSHPIYRLYLEGQAIDEDDLLDDVHSIDLAGPILEKRAVGHHGILDSRRFLLVVRRDDHRVVVLDRLAEFVRSQLLHVEKDLAFGDYLVHADGPDQVA